MGESERLARVPDAAGGRTLDPGSARFAALKAFRRFLWDARGATVIEYALIAGFIAAVIAGTVYALGTNVLVELWQKVGDGVRPK
jgi:Flp pilus assembly pilin Flp